MQVLLKYVAAAFSSLKYYTKIFLQKGMPGDKNWFFK